MKDNCHSFKFKTVQQSPALFIFPLCKTNAVKKKAEQIKKNKIKRVSQLTQEINHNHADRKA